MKDRRRDPDIITDERIKEIKAIHLDPRLDECYLNTWLRTRELQAIVRRMEKA